MAPAIQMVSGLLKVGAKKQLAASKATLTSDEITSGKNIKWKPRGPGREHLFKELQTLYWEGARRDLENILWTLKNWQDESLKGVEVQDETDFFVHGFDTFIDQVSQESRAFANRYSKINRLLDARMVLMDNRRFPEDDHQDQGKDA
jgi:hypothetical protein